jgi:hypothetical protein
MQQTREELLRLAFDCFERAARLLDLAEKDLSVIKKRRAYGVRRGAFRARRSKTSLPTATTLAGSEIGSP